MNIQLINPVEDIEMVLHSAQPLVKDKPVVLGLVKDDGVSIVAADQIRFRQIIWNLLSNAIKFTDEGSVKVHLSLTEDNMVLIKIQDSGVGMSEEGLAVIFQRFSQVDGSPTRQAGGTGLGLTITRQLVEMHGGEIGVTSEVGKGTAIWFTMPITAPEDVES